MTSPIPFSIDDKDLDDAALWAVIDSAAAASVSRSSASASKSRKPLAIRYPSYRSPPTPISRPSPPPNPKHQHYRQQQLQYSPNSDSRGEIVNDRPLKVARTCSSEASESSPMALAHRTPPSPVAYASPEAYLSPGINGRGEGHDQDVTRHSLSGRFPTVSLFKECQNAAMAILEKSDYTMISGSPFIKKSGWRKISFYFNVSYEIKDKSIEFDENRNVQRAEFVVRAYMQGGRFSDGWGSCERREKRFLKPNHDIPIELYMSLYACAHTWSRHKSPKELGKARASTFTVLLVKSNSSKFMAQQEDGWPLGLRPLNARVGLVRNRNLSGSVSFNTLLTGSPSSSTLSSSDLDTESTGSFFRDKSITLGSLIGVSNILELSRRSTRRRPTDTLRDQKNYKPRPWLFSLCSKLTTDAVNTNNTPSLGHFLEAERRAASIYRRNHNPAIYGPNDFSPVLPVTNPNPLFVGDRVAPHASPSLSADGERRSNRELLEHGDGYGAPLLLSCMCGQLIK
ncbi:peptide transporter family protein [Citrus sinensis]|uniref:Peptide transporter family protein n=1 Tax=Citrus sinensis TaxID=2711 RepID=A0ACB8JTB5_CITSI|nr:peptide transporter family protein [Citrus sinensis]